MSAPNISATEYRRRYLASLNLQNKVNAYNLDANSLFKQTGQPSAPADTRTITEKTADTETTKRTALQELLTITDRGNANQIVQSLGEDELRFVIEQIGAIEREIKPRFRSGVPANVFLDFLQRYIQKFEETKGVEPPIESTLAPVIEFAEKATGNIPRSKKGTAGASGEYNSAMSAVPDILDATKGAIVAYFTGVKRELVRQGKEEPLTPEQVQRRRDLIADIRSLKSGKAYIDYFTANPNKLDDINAMLGNAGQNTAGRGVRGKGLVKTPIKYKPTYYEFGKYVLDGNKLEDGYVSMKRKNGRLFVDNFPIQKVSSKVSNILKKVVGGGIPTYEDISCLSDKEKNYLWKLTKTAKVPKELGIPAPDKDAQDKEYDRFEILRGQILAGNDNKELVKEFKLSLLKLSNDGVIPKREAREVLVELAHIGL